MKDRLYVIGAGDFGREVLCWALQVPQEQRSWQLAGVLDDRPNLFDGMNLPARIVGSPNEFNFSERDLAVVAVGKPSERAKIVAQLKCRKVRFTSIIHPSVVMGLNNEWGDGCIFCPGVVISTNVTIGEHVIFNSHSGAGHDARIGDFCTLSGAVDVTGHVRLGNRVMLGSHASVLPRASVGDDAIVGAGSVVLRNVAPGETVMGVPAKVIWPGQAIGPVSGDISPI